MTINKERNDAELKVTLEGRLDTLSAPQLNQELSDSLDGITSLIFDFEKLEYISSAGIRVIITAQKTMNQQGTMKILHVNDEIMEIFEVTRLTDIMIIEN